MYPALAVDRACGSEDETDAPGAIILYSGTFVDIKNLMKITQGGKGLVSPTVWEDVDHYDDSRRLRWLVTLYPKPEAREIDESWCPVRCPLLSQSTTQIRGMALPTHG